MRNLKNKVIAVATASALAIGCIGINPLAVDAATSLKTAKLSATKLTLREGKSKTLKVSKKPSKAKVKFVSNKKSVATVTSKGKVTAKNVGTAVIRAKVTYKGKSRTLACKVTVNVPTKKTVYAKTSYTVKPSATNSKAYKLYKFTSSKKSVATVNSKGKVTAKKSGTTTITWRTKKGNKKAGSIKITVKAAKVSKIKLNATKKTLKAGASYQLKTVITPSYAYNKKLTFKSSNTKVATVTSKGKITAKAYGKATITVTARDGSKKKAKIVITVPAVKVSKVTITNKPSALTVGETFVLGTAVTPSNATNKTLAYTSSNTTVATIDAAGKIVAKAAGTTVITAKAKDGSNKAASFTLTVKAKSVAYTYEIKDASGSAVTLKEAKTLTIKYDGKTKVLSENTMNKVREYLAAPTASLVEWSSITNQTFDVDGTTVTVKGTAGSDTKTVTAGSYTATITLAKDKVTVVYNGDVYALTVNGDKLVVTTTAEQPVIDFVATK